MGTTTDTPAAPRPKRALPPLMQLTEAAAERLRALYAAGEEGKLLRIAVKTKGCSGMAYDLSWTDAPAPTDERVTDKGVTVLVDRKAAAGRADRIAARAVPPHRPEGRPRFVLRHARDLHERERAGLGGEEEVLGHLACRMQ